MKIEDKAKEWVSKHPNATLEEAFIEGHKYRPNKVSLTEEEKKKREIEFANTLRPYIDEYGKELIIRFFNYWSQWSGSQMFWEKEKQKKAFDLPKRLATFNRNNYGQRNNFKQKQVSSSIFTRATASVLNSVCESPQSEFGF